MNNLMRAIQSTLALCFLLLVFMPLSGQQKSVRKPRTNVAGSAALKASGLITKDIPDKIERKGNYLFYLHGLIIENEGIRPTSPKFGVYEYEEILETFKNKGFIVISEARPKGTDPEQYAEKVVEQIKELIKAGVAPRNITVAGASRGGGIAMITSTLLKNRQVKFVIMAACGDWDVYRKVGINLWGEILSVYDINDDMASTCSEFFKRSTGISKKREVVLKLGLGHGILYRPLKEWVDLVAEWARAS
jgi:hypothetical protein